MHVRARVRVYVCLCARACAVHHRKEKLICGSSAQTPSKRARTFIWVFLSPFLYPVRRSEQRRNPSHVGEGARKLIGKDLCQICARRVRTHQRPERRGVRAARALVTSLQPALEGGILPVHCAHKGDVPP